MNTSRLSPKTLNPVAIAVSLFISSLVGCGGGGDQSFPPTTQPPPPTTVGPTVDVARKRDALITLLHTMAASRRTISGQHIGHAKPDSNGYTSVTRGYDLYVSALPQTVGVVAADFGDDSPSVIETLAPAGYINTAVSQLNRHLAAGGVVMVNVHLRNPWTGGNIRDMGVGSVAELTTAGTAANRRWRGYLKELGDGLEQFQNAGYPVLFRPLHEANGNWFWYGKLSVGDYSTLWQSIRVYLESERKLRNIAFVYAANWDPCNGSCSIAAPGSHLAAIPAAYSPEVIGLDAYDTNLATAQSMATSLSALRGTSNALGKPFIFSAIGPTNYGAMAMDGTWDTTEIARVIDRWVPDASAFVAWHSYAGGCPNVSVQLSGVCALALVHNRNVDQLLSNQRIANLAAIRALQ